MGGKVKNPGSQTGMPLAEAVKFQESALLVFGIWCDVIQVAPDHYIVQHSKVCCNDGASHLERGRANSCTVHRLWGWNPVCQFCASLAHAAERAARKAEPPAEPVKRKRG